MTTDQTPSADRLDDLRTEYANTGRVVSDGAVWLFSQVVVLREEVQRLRAAAVSVPPPPPATRADLRDRIAAALTEAAYECDGNCGLSERDCYDAHPITFSARVGGTTHVDAPVAAIADVVLGVLPPPADRAAVYTEVADRLAADAEQGDKEGLTRIYRRSAAKQVREWGEELRRVVDEEQPAIEARQDGAQS